VKIVISISRNTSIDRFEIGGVCIRNYGLWYNNNPAVRACLSLRYKTNEKIRLWLDNFDSHFYGDLQYELYLALFYARIQILFRTKSIWDRLSFNWNLVGKTQEMNIDRVSQSLFSQDYRKKLLFGHFIWLAQQNMLQNTDELIELLITRHQCELHKQRNQRTVSLLLIMTIEVSFINYKR